MKILFGIIFLLTYSLGFSQGFGIVSQSPAITEIIFYLGKENNLVGRTDYCLYPKETKDIPSVGNMTVPNVEKVIFLDPEYIIFQSHSNERLITQLNKLGVKSLKFKTPKTLDEIIEITEEINEIFEKNENGKEKISILKKKLEEFRNNSKKTKNPLKVYYSLGSAHTEYTAGSGTYIDDLITSSGAQNIVKEKGWSIPLEVLIMEQPDVIIGDSYTLELMKKSSKYRELKAIQQNRLIVVEKGLINSPTPRLIEEGLKIINDELKKMETIK
ncbi:MAG: ABC transporter substrate-binding protein [Fusobacteriaceae bacterium]